MNERTPNMALKCRSGELAGARFELGIETFIGVDDRNRLVVASDARTLARRYALIVARNGRFALEKLGGSVAITVNGMPVTGPLELNRFDIIDLGGTAEFVFGHAVTATMERVQQPEDPPGPANQTPPSPRQEYRTPPAPLVIPQPPNFRGMPDPRQTQDDSAFRDMPLLTPRALPRIPRPTPPEPMASGPGATVDEGATISFPKPPFELTINVPGKGHTTYGLDFGDNTIGRGDACDISVPDPEKMISRKHAIVRVTGDQVELIDLQTANGTFVRGRRIASRMIDPGTSFVLGPRLEFKLQRK